MLLYVMATQTLYIFYSSHFCLLAVPVFRTSTEPITLHSPGRDMSAALSTTRQPSLTPEKPYLKLMQTQSIKIIKTKGLKRIDPYYSGISKAT